jgi:hypothetical protein
LHYPLIKLAMSTLLEEALEKVVALPQDEQDAIASQILASLADEDALEEALRRKAGCDPSRGTRSP